MRWTPQLPSEVAGRITPALGGGGVAAWLAFLTTHQVSTTAVIAGTAVVCVTVVSHCVAKCLGPRYQHRAEIIEAAAKAKTIEMKATSDAEIRKRREELLTSLLDEIHADPSMAGQADVAAAALQELRRAQPNISLAWIGNQMPFKRDVDRENYVEAFRRAGLN